jgi:hypothetical protein
MNKPSFDRARAALPRVAAVSVPILAALQGKKTYLGAALAAALAAYYVSVGNGEAAGTMIVLALGLGGLRGAVGRVTEKPLLVLARDEAYERHVAEVMSRPDPPSIEPPAPPAPDRTLTRDLARFEDEGGPPMAERKARLDDEPNRPRGFACLPPIVVSKEAFLTINQARRLDGREPLPFREPDR